MENEGQAGPERFAPWYPLLQKIRRDDRNQQHNDSSHIPVAKDDSHQAEEKLGEEFVDILEHIHHSLSVAPKVFDNHLVPSNEYPAVQLRNGVLTLDMSRPPRNLEWLQMRLKSARHVPDWPTNKWQSYTMHSYLGTTKEAIMFEMMPLFQAFPNRPEYIRTFCQRFDDFPEYAPFALGIEKPCPGFAQGFRLEAYPCMNIEYVSAAVCLVRDHASLVHPHLAGDFTSGDVNDLEAVSARHGAALVYMRNLALAHIRAEILEDMAGIMTFTTNGTYINFFAHYASTSAEGRLEYHQYPIASVNLMGSYFEFIQGVTMLRNCQDHALFIATHLRDDLEKYHMRNGINAWTYHLDEDKHILSEGEDSEMEDGECREYGNKGSTRRDNLKRTGISGKRICMYNEASSCIKIGPNTRAARVEEKGGSGSKKRPAGKSPNEAPRKRRR
ncbi:hypothetical protein TrVGV298_000601 [Trichoderma virens]|nr:hypothetical protein TrVGV298_000601 [Trichoderma virens]